MERKERTEAREQGDFLEAKKLLRRQALARRDAMSPEERRIASLRMTDRIIGHQWFYRASKVLLFASFGSEIDTMELLAEALRKGKEVYLPRVEEAAGAMEGEASHGQCTQPMSRTKRMEFYRIMSLEELRPGYRGIPEPEGVTERYWYPGGAQPGEAEAWAARFDTLMIMPGAAFDPYRNRIGYGGGFYDRYLADKPLLRLHSIAIGFRCQMVEEIPAQETDIKPYQVILM